MEGNKENSEKDGRPAAAAPSTECIRLGVANGNPELPTGEVIPPPPPPLPPTSPQDQQDAGTLTERGAKTTTETTKTEVDAISSTEDSGNPYKYESKMWEELDSMGVYHGVMPQDDVSTLLTKQGDFILRKLEERIKPILAVTVRWDSELVHFPFYASEVNGKSMYMLTPGKAFATPNEVIRYHQTCFVPVYEAIQLINPIPKQTWELSRSNVSMDQKIGEGAFGEVWKGTLWIRKPNESIKLPVAVKVMKLEPMKASQSNQLRKFQEEARMMRQLNHKNVVRLHGILFSEVDIMIVMELIQDGSLDKFLKDHKGLGMLTRASYCYDAAAGLAYLHSQNWMHRDIAARNCLVNEGGKIIKISDFGMAAQGRRYQIPNDEKVPTRWQSPEVIYHRLYVRESDIWSYGMLVYEIHTGHVPFVGTTTTVIREKLVQANFRPSVNFGAKPEIISLLEKCWLLDSTKRPAMATVAETLKQYCIHTILPVQTPKLINQEKELKNKALKSANPAMNKKSSERRNDRTKSGKVMEGPGQRRSKSKVTKSTMGQSTIQSTKTVVNTDPEKKQKRNSRSGRSNDRTGFGSDDA